MLMHQVLGTDYPLAGGVLATDLSAQALEVRGVYRDADAQLGAPRSWMTNEDGDWEMDAR